MMGLWNKLARPQERNAPFRLMCIFTFLLTAAEQLGSMVKNQRLAEVLLAAGVPRRGLGGS